MCLDISLHLLQEAVVRHRVVLVSSSLSPAVGFLTQWQRWICDGIWTCRYHRWYHLKKSDAAGLSILQQHPPYPGRPWFAPCGWVTGKQNGIDVDTCLCMCLCFFIADVEFLTEPPPHSPSCSWSYLLLCGLCYYSRTMLYIFSDNSSDSDDSESA